MFLNANHFENLAPDTLMGTGAFDVQKFSPDLFVAHEIERPGNIAKAVAKRQADFLAGRLMVQIAQQHLSVDTTQVGIGERRAPVWPIGQTGSITHSRGKVACIISTDPNALIGIDLEHIAKASALSAIEKTVLSAPEIERLHAQTCCDYATAATALFSAKEALFKALNAQAGRYFGFDAAKLSKPFHPSCLTLQLTTDLGRLCVAGTQYQINLRMMPSYVLTFHHSIRRTEINLP
jgi:enterobactin synthetase component D